MAESLTQYSEDLSMYAFRYSQITRVYSEIVNYATGYVWGYATLRDKDENESLILLAGIDYLIESIRMSQLYFNLHPGFEEIINERYNALLKTLPVYIASSNMEDSISLQFNLERAIIYEDIPSKTAYLERILAEVKAILITKELLSNQSIYVGHSATQTSPEIMNSNTVEKELSMSWSPLDNIFLISTALILISVIYIIIKRIRL